MPGKLMDHCDERIWRDGLRLSFVRGRPVRTTPGVFAFV